MTRFPLRYAHQNILVGDGDVRAVGDDVAHERVDASRRVAVIRTLAALALVGAVVLHRALDRCAFVAEAQALLDWLGKPSGRRLGGVQSVQPKQGFQC